MATYRSGGHGRSSNEATIDLEGAEPTESILQQAIDLAELDFNVWNLLIQIAPESYKPNRELLDAKGV
jgi:hypothetical protein